MENIHYSNKNNFEILKNLFKSEGVDKIHILADFDSTLTKAFDKGIKKPGIFQIINKYNLLGEDFSAKQKKLFDYYYPIEIDHNISNYDKKNIMQEWREKTFELLISYGYNMKVVESIGSNNFIKLRDGYKDLFNIINNESIPLIIMSAAGTGTESIERYLENNIENTKNIKIITNSFIWNKEGLMIGYNKPLIHAFNKDETIINNYPEIHKIVKDKKNVILLGDSLGDHHMIDGFEYDNLIKIGFLNENIEDKLDEYLKRYDILITGDGDMSFINNLLKECF